jgi:hypothetical protein
MKYDVTAIALNARTGAVIGGPRTDRVDPKTNPVFRECHGIWDIEDAYEAFWNRLCDCWKHGPNYEKVNLLRVEEVL